MSRFNRNLLCITIAAVFMWLLLVITGDIIFVGFAILFNICQLLYYKYANRDDNIKIE